jgi:hypothetical protein
MNQHNNSLGNCSTNGVPLNSTNDNQSLIHGKARWSGDIRNVMVSHGGLDKMRHTLTQLNNWINSEKASGRKPGKRFKDSLAKWIQIYDDAERSNVGMPSGSESVTTQTNAPTDIPTMPLSGFQLLERKCYIVKPASSGTTAGGFYAELKTTDLSPYITGTSIVFRVKEVRSWTVTSANGVHTGFAGVSVAARDGSSSTDSITPIWSENWTPIGQGYAGIITKYPAGDFPYYTETTDLTPILTHFTSLGGTGGVTGIPVVFHVIIEYLL